MYSRAIAKPKCQSRGRKFNPLRLKIMPEIVAKHIADFICCSIRTLDTFFPNLNQHDCSIRVIDCSIRVPQSKHFVTANKYFNCLNICSYLTSFRNLSRVTLV